MSLILVVDDDAVVREPIAASLRGAGHETEFAGDGREALDRIESRRPDLILLDLVMPGMDGLTCLSRIRNHPSSRQVPVVLLTNMADRKLVAKAATMGVQEYLLKARFSLRELLDRVNKHLHPPEGGAAAA